MTLVLTAVDAGVCTLTLNRPEALNAFSPALLIALIDALDHAAQDENVRVIVLEGAGRAFSAGVDLKILQGQSFVAGRVGDVFDGAAMTVTDKIRSTRLPVIAKVHGACFTGALEMALHCDFILTTADTKFGDTHAEWGLRPTWGMSQNLARAVGVRRARELSFSARRFSGADAKAWGLANEAYADKSALDENTHACASAIAAASPGAVSAYKDLYRLHETNRPLEDALTEEVDRDYPAIDDTNKRLAAFGK
ncbi:MAG: enoyl-CoA hydratase/isomerase family protein [Pseudomonadota bacterium]